MGYATEAAAACRDFAIQTGHPSLIAVIYPGNIPSQRVAEKIGLTAVGVSSDGKGNPFSIYRPVFA